MRGWSTTILGILAFRDLRFKPIKKPEKETKEELKKLLQNRGIFRNLRDQTRDLRWSVLQK